MFCRKCKTKTSGSTNGFTNLGFNVQSDGVNSCHALMHAASSTSA